MDKPLIQYAVEETFAACMVELFFVIGRNKPSIEDHFQQAYVSEQNNQHNPLVRARDILPSYISRAYTSARGRRPR